MHTLKFLPQDVENFKAIERGEKRLETRAGLPAYFEIQPGDTLLLKCGEEKLEREVGCVEHFDSVEEMLKKINFKKIVPDAQTQEEVVKTYNTYPGYKERLKEHGILVFELN